MYSTCIFCNGDLGRNESLEHFPIGRRLAYDAAKGRLWAVCARCERWNLSPLETRWEAIEEAERAYRATRLRVSTDNIGLAQLREGLELVRIGAPPTLEFAGWRYGDQFGRRRRKTIALGALGMVGASAQGIGWIAGAAFAGAEIGMMLGLGVGMTLQAVTMTKSWKDTKIPTVFVRDNDGALLYVTRQNARSAALVPVGNRQYLYLKLPHREVGPAGRVRALFGKRSSTSPARHGAAILRDEAAHRALATILPHINASGGSARRVREAVDVIGARSSLEQLLNVASTHRSYNNIVPGENLIGGLPSPMRLALEMVLHEDDERRAMEGELQALEQRWREAEEIASIADALLLPPDVEERLDALRSRAGKT
jgi:hypothetical protein